MGLKAVLWTAGLTSLLATQATAQYVTVGNGSYRTTLIDTAACGDTWQGPATSFFGGTPASPLITDNLQDTPIPTNDWWSSLIWPTGDPPNPYSSPLIAYPLVTQAEGNGLRVGWQNSSTASAGRVGFNHGLTVGLSGFNAPETAVHDYSDLTVTADWNDGELRATFGHGLPYVYFERNSTRDARIILTGDNPTALSNNGATALVRSGGGYYALFGPAGSSWAVNGSTVTSSLNGADFFSVALIAATSDAEALNLLSDYTARAYSFVTDSRVDWIYDEATSEVTTTFSLTFDQKETGAGILNETYIAMMPHQWRHSPTAVTGLLYDAAYGPLEVVSGDSFQTVYEFDGVLPTLPRVANSDSEFNEATLRDYLQELANFDPPLIDTYFGGKDIHKLMQAALIADQYGETDLVQHHVTRAKQVLEDWFTTGAGEQSDVETCQGRRALYYDEEWGTIIGFPASFGSNTYLNDHHFHYGYWVMTAALIAQFDPAWAQQSNWGGMVDLLIRDVASLDRDDPMFPFLRSFDPYAGHGWAGGPGDSGSGNNQESSSESINFWAGMILWGEETGNQEIRDAGIYMYTTEVHAIEEYWFDVHEEIFPRIDYPHEVTGIKFGDGVAYATFFSGEDEAILGIQNIPVTGCMLYWGRHPDEVIEIFNAMEQANGVGNPLNPFQDLLWSFLATADADRALALFNAAGPDTYGVEGGESRAHTYHWLHGLSELGNLVTTISADRPTYAVFENDGVLTYSAYNASDTVETIVYSDGTSFRIPANRLIAVQRPMALTITSPKAGTEYLPEDNITFEALADHLDGLAITQVEFFVNGNSAGVDPSEPYTASYSPPAEGDYTLYAVATDSNGETVQTQTINFSADLGQLPFNGDPFLIAAGQTTRIEAEEYDIGDPNDAYFDQEMENQGGEFRPDEGVDIEVTGDTGGGFNVGYMGAGEWMEYTLDVEVGGLYDVAMRVATQEDGPSYNIGIEGDLISGLFEVPNTGGFQNWTTIQSESPVLLPAGKVILRINTVTGLGNINWFELTGPAESSLSDTWMILGSLSPEEELLRQMTLAEKIGQMTQAERDGASPADVQRLRLGSILSGGGSLPEDDSVAGWAAMVDAYQTAATSTRLGIPILYGIDAVHGHSNVRGATIFPHNIGLGATRDPLLVEEVARITAVEMSATAIPWTFSPAVSVARDVRWGRTYESMGETPEIQNLLAGAYVSGYQGAQLGDRVVATAKHYVADGGTFLGIDQGDSIMDEAELRAIHMPGFLQALEQNVATIMPSYSSWNGEKMHGQAYLINDVLKGELGFDGFIISDWNAIEQLPGSYYDQVVASANAGVDMFMEPFRYEQFIATLTDAVNNGDVSMNRIDDAVRRILQVKFDSGVMDNPFSDPDLVNAGLVGAPEHRAVAREAVRKSAVLLKNDGILPLEKEMDLFVAGVAADNIGYQCGGWTITWAGTTDPDITEGTTILEGIEEAVAMSGGSVRYSEQGFSPSGDAAVVVLAEPPYVEGGGDNLNNLQIETSQLQILDRVLDAGLPTVVILISGRPMLVTPQIEDSNAFVAAFLPGTEGNGVSDVIFGDFDFTGTLPMTWPRDSSQLELNFGDSPYDPLFPYGFGLSLAGGQL